MATCLLHLGTHKTGTSSIQKTLASLEQKKYTVMKGSFGANMTGIIKNGFKEPLRREMQRERVSAVSQSKRSMEEVHARSRAAVKKFLDDNAKNNVIISAEGFDNLTPAEFEDFLKFIPHDEVRGIVYVREPIGMMGSALQQRVKGGLSNIHVPNLMPNYKKNISKYIGKIDLTVAPFEKEQMHESCVVRDFCSRVGIEISPSDVINTNEGMSRSAVALLLALNRFRKSTGLKPHGSGVLVDWLRGAPGEKISLHPDIAPRQTIKENLDWLEAEFGIRFKEGKTSPHQIMRVEELYEVSDSAERWLRDQDPAVKSVGELMNDALQRRMAQRGKNAA